MKKSDFCSLIANKRYITLVGPPGTGKTALAQYMQSLGFKAYFDDIENPYLKRHYLAEKVTFPMQLHYLAQRIQQTLQIRSDLELSRKTKAVQEHCLYEDIFLFCFAYFRMGRLEQADYAKCCAVFQNAQSALPKPDLVLYLQADPQSLIAHQQHKGPPFDEALGLPALRYLCKMYDGRFKVDAKKHAGIKIEIIKASDLQFARKSV